MWATVLSMGVVAGLEPQRIAAVVFMLSRAKPIRLLLAYCVGGFGMTLIVGGVILVVFGEVGIGSKQLSST